MQKNYQYIFLLKKLTKMPQFKKKIPKYTFFGTSRRLNLRDTDHVKNYFFSSRRSHTRDATSYFFFFFILTFEKLLI